jgi:hypothetical protein
MKLFEFCGLNFFFFPLSYLSEFTLKCVIGFGRFVRILEDGWMDGKWSANSSVEFQFSSIQLMVCWFTLALGLLGACCIASLVEQTFYSLHFFVIIFYLSKKNGIHNNSPSAKDSLEFTLVKFWV